VDKGSEDGAGSKSERDGGNIPTGADPFAQDVGGDFKDDVRDVEDREKSIVIVAREAEIFLEARQLGISFDFVLAVAVTRVFNQIEIEDIDLPIFARSMKQNR